MRQFIAQITMGLAALIISIGIIESASALSIISGDGTETCIASPDNCTNGIQAISPHALWQSNDPNGRGAVWISYEDTGVSGSTLAPTLVTDVVMTVKETFTAYAGSMLTLDVWADDTAEVFIDGVSVFAPNFTQDICANGSIGCESDEEGIIVHTFLTSGEHMISFDVYQVGTGSTNASNPFGLLYSGEVVYAPESSASVPEPSASLLLFVGLVGLTGYGWRKRGA